MTICRTALVGILLITALSAARAQEPIVDNDFNIDAVTGPVLGSSRIVGMGGAYTAIADGIAGAIGQALDALSIELGLEL